MLALHGAMGGYDQGLILARTVGAPGFRYVAISRPGYLGTSLALGKTPEEQADLYRDVLDALGVGDAAVIAVSGGGPSNPAPVRAEPPRDRCWGVVVVSRSAARTVRLPLGWYLMPLIARVGPLVAAMRRNVARDRTTRPAGRSGPGAPGAYRPRSEVGPLLQALQLSTLDHVAPAFPGRATTSPRRAGTLWLDLERIAVPALVVHGT